MNTYNSALFLTVRQYETCYEKQRDSVFVLFSGVPASENKILEGFFLPGIHVGFWEISSHIPWIFGNVGRYLSSSWTSKSIEMEAEAIWRSLGVPLGVATGETFLVPSKGCRRKGKRREKRIRSLSICSFIRSGLKEADSL